MAGDQGPLTAREFYKGIERLEARMDRGFDGVREELTGHSERIAVLESAKASTTKKATAWGSAVAGAVLVIVEAFKALRASP